MRLVYLPLMLLDGIGLPGGILLCQQLSLANAITVMHHHPQHGQRNLKLHVSIVRSHHLTHGLESGNRRTVRGLP